MKNFDKSLKFSLIVPTRKRSVFFLKLIDSVIKTTKEIENIEILAVVDSDDKEGLSYTEHPLVKRLIRPRGNNMSKDYHTWAYYQSSGKYIFVLNDDCELKTKNWDVIAYNRLENCYDDGIVYGKTFETKDQKHVGFCFFPIFSRSGIEVLGHVLSPFFPGWEADKQIFHVYNAVNRVFDLKEIKIDHAQGWTLRDECNVKMKSVTKTNYLTDRQFIELVEKDANKLRIYIDKFKIFL